MNDAAPTIKPSLRPLIRPRSVALVGLSSKPGSAGHVVLANMLKGGFDGAVHLVGRSGGTLDGRPVLTDVSQLPEGVDLAILLVPADAVAATVQALTARRAKAAICFASGFAEMGEAGLAQQQAIAELAEAGGLALLGPNTLGFFNYVDGFHVMMVELVLPPRLNPAQGRGLAVVAQSGGIGAHVAESLRARGVPLSYMMTTGNEASQGIAELIDFFIDDEHTATVAIYAEQVRCAPDFIAAARRARAAGKGLVLLHPGRSERSRAAAQSHTGALAGNHAAMQLMLDHAGVLVVDSLEELIDVSQLLLRFPQAPAGGLALVTASGALCGITADYVEPFGLDIPALAEAQAARLREHLPAYTPPRNPLDLGTLVSWKPELIELGMAAVLDDEAIGCVLCSLPMPNPEASVVWLSSYLRGIQGRSKPSIFVMQNEDVPFTPEFLQTAREAGAIVMRSPERALRALARVARFARGEPARQGAVALAGSQPMVPALSAGTQVEWRGKAVLQAIGVPVPQGALARDADEAVQIAHRIGWPVVLKAQAAALAHKSEAGGVLLNLADEAALRAAWTQLYANIDRHAPGLVLDGALVEKMGARGLELVVGASRDAQWGPILMVGLGGIWVEALGDVQLLPPDLPKAAIVDALQRLKGAKLLNGFRGSAPVDLDAVAEVVMRVGQLMLAQPQIIEVDVNPLVAYPAGQGVVALDALLVVQEAP